MSTLTDQHIKDALQAYVDAVSGDSVEAVVDLFAEDAVVEDPIGTEPQRGKDALRAFYQIAVDNVERMTLEGNVRVRDHYGAASMLAKVKGADVTMETLDVMEFNEDGLITKMTAYWGDSNMVMG
jgi:steroid delta-isomerase